MAVNCIVPRSAGKKCLPLVLLQPLGITFPSQVHQAPDVEL